MVGVGVGQGEGPGLFVCRLVCLFAGLFVCLFVCLFVGFLFSEITDLINSRPNFGCK